MCVLELLFFNSLVSIFIHPLLFSLQDSSIYLAMFISSFHPFIHPFSFFFPFPFFYFILHNQRPPKWKQNETDKTTSSLSSVIKT